MAQFLADFESGFEDQETTMHLINVLNNETSHFIFKIGSSEFRNLLNINPRKIDSLQIAESFFTNDSYFGNLYNKSDIEKNRLNRQKRMLDQTNSILEIIEQELGNS